MVNAQIPLAANKAGNPILGNKLLNKCLATSQVVANKTKYIADIVWSFYKQADVKGLLWKYLYICTTMLNNYSLE